MTAIRQRRSRATIVGLLAALVGMAAMLALGIAGLQTLADSTAGRQAGGDDQVLVAQRLPFTSTALIGVVDEAGRLTSLVVGVLESDGTGGSLVQIPVAADPSSGSADELTPIDAVLEVAGPISFREAVERLTGLSFDVIEIADPTRFAQLITPLGDLTVDLPGALLDASSQETWDAGVQPVTAPGAARLITATDPAVASWAYEPARAAVWSAIADRVGAGIGSASPVAADSDLTVPGSTDEFLDRLFAGPVTFRAVQFQALDDRVADRIEAPYREAFGPDAVESVVLVDRAETLMVFGSIAPARLGAPLDAPSFRIVNGLSADDAARIGRTPTDLTEVVVRLLIYTKVNVVSVVERPDAEVPDVTQMRVADPTLLGDLLDVYEPHFGELEVVPVDVAIDGIDVEIVLGRSYLDRLAEEPAPDVAGSPGDVADGGTEGGAATDD